MSFTFRQGAHQINVQTAEPSSCSREDGDGGLGVSPHLGSLAGKAFTAPLPDIFPQSGPNETAADQFGRRTGTAMAESVEGVEDSTAESHWNQRTELIPGDVTPENGIVPGDPLELEARVLGHTSVLSTCHCTEVNRRQGTAGDHWRSGEGIGNIIPFSFDMTEF